MRFVHGDSLRSSIVSTLSGQKKDVAVAFIGEGVCRRLGLEQAHSARIICDLWSGACNPAAINDLLEAGAEVRTLDGLHAKVYVGDVAAVVTSANASSNGLTQPNSPQDFGLEAGILVDENPVLREIMSWFEAQFSNAKLIKPSDLDAVPWPPGRTTPLRSVPPNRHGSILRSAIGEPDLLRGVGFVFTSQENDPKDIRHARRVAKRKHPRSSRSIDNRSDDDFFTLWDAPLVRRWPAQFFSYHRGSRGGLYLRSMVRTVKDPDEGFVIAESDWSGVAQALVPGLTKAAVKKADQSLALEIFDLIEGGRVFRSAHELAEFCSKHAEFYAFLLDGE